MSRGGATPSTAPVGWVYLEGKYTIRWRRGDPMAYVLGAGQLGDHGMAGVLDTIPVSPAGWTVRAHDQNTNPVRDGVRALTRTKPGEDKSHVLRH